jgi:hypothetical protein
MDGGMDGGRDGGGMEGWSGEWRDGGRDRGRDGGMDGGRHWGREHDGGDIGCESMTGRAAGGSVAIADILGSMALADISLV